GDAGASWALLAPPTTYSLCDVEPFGLNGAYLAGPGFTILKYDQSPVPTLISRFDAAPGAFGVDFSWDIADAAGLDRFRINRRELTGGGRSRTFDVGANDRTFRDEDVVPGTPYEYQLFTVDRSGDEFASAPVIIHVPSAALTLLPNVPNPFNPATTLRFVVPARDHVSLTIYDVAGRYVTTLVDAVRAAGMNEAEWTGKDDNGNSVASGVYVSRLRVGTRSVSRTLVLLK
ncbi:MAG TPA: FlgD immunoglobulin-like domain containing protein, partial [Candidatus Krumholzibacteria bacterium]|nr:FlgD immunoglobulin-like domain containing protein [Candidatus Krumholzibacteria bacterium]